MLKWLRYDRAAREQHTAQLIERIRLPLLSGEELVADRYAKFRAIGHLERGAAEGE